MPALLSPLPPDDFRKRWSVTGHPNLRVEAEYEEEHHRVARLRGYSVVDTRHHALDRRHLVCFRTALAEIREWIRDNAQTIDPPLRST